MTRKTVIFAVVAIAVLVSVATVVSTTIAQKAQFAHITAESTGDSDVVAVVNGTNVTRGDISKPAEFHRTADPDLTTNDATKLVIVPVIDDALINVEAKRRGLTPSDADATTFMQPHKDACLGSNGQECRDHITSLGLTVDDYWASALPEYKDDLGSMKLFQAVFTEQSLDDGTHEELVAAEKAFRVELRNAATITWNDADLQRLYEQALASE